VTPPRPDGRRTLDGRGAWAVLATLALLVLVNVPLLGADPWPFEPGPIEPRGTLGFVTDAVGEEWDPEALRAGALLGGLAVALAAAVSLRRAALRPRLLAGLAVAVAVLLILPAVVLQVALRESTEPWFFTNDATYEIELAGDLLREGENPYGHDYSESGLERFYSFDGSPPDASEPAPPALSHFLYFPGPALTAALWTALPGPWDDYRFPILLATLGCFFALLVFRAPLPWVLAAGAVAAANPLAVRAAWFGNADAMSYVFLLLAFALVTRRHWLGVGAALGAAIVFKQFAVLAVPFLAVMILQLAGRRELGRAVAAGAAVVVAGFLPFIAWDPGAFFADTLPANDPAYRIVGPGLASLLVESGLIDDRRDPYPFVPLLALVWLPLTAWLVWKQAQRRALWVGAAGFAISIFVFIWLSRVFQPSFLVWPLLGVVVAAVLAAAERHAPPARPADP
jgi:hypothetical protein